MPTTAAYTDELDTNLEAGTLRVRIINVDGETYNGMRLATPGVSLPHIGKEGIASWTGDNLIITLDDGHILFGFECWWEPVEPAALTP